jgi:hypothetical protein
MMHLVRFAEAPEYAAPGHHDMAMLRLQGREAGPSSEVWVGMSVIAGRGTTLSSSPQEKMYVVLDGVLHKNDVSLGKLDWYRIAGGERRRLTNGTNSAVTVLLVVPLSADERQRGL